MLLLNDHPHRFEHPRGAANIIFKIVLSVRSPLSLAAPGREGRPARPQDPHGHQRPLVGAPPPPLAAPGAELGAPPLPHLNLDESSHLQINL